MPCFPLCGGQGGGGGGRSGGKQTPSLPQPLPIKSASSELAHPLCQSFRHTLQNLAGKKGFRLPCLRHCASINATKLSTGSLDSSCSVAPHWPLRLSTPHSIHASVTEHVLPSVSHTWVWGPDVWLYVLSFLSSFVNTAVSFSTGGRGGQALGSPCAHVSCKSASTGSVSVSCIISVAPTRAGPSRSLHL